MYRRPPFGVPALAGSASANPSALEFSSTRPAEAGTPNLSYRAAQRVLDRVARLRILDPACGSGSFLICAYQFLLDWHLQFYLQLTDDPESGRSRGDETQTSLENENRDSSRRLLLGEWGATGELRETAAVSPLDYTTLGVPLHRSCFCVSCKNAEDRLFSLRMKSQF